MKKITLGVLAHVDAGKTTLSEGILYLTGTTRKMGRVDKKDTFLDNDSMERARGITVFSKEARFTLGDTEFTLIDTPGHADLSAEMERALSVLDYAVLVVSGVEGVQSHTRTLVKLFEIYRIPCFIFINKMDMPGASKERTLMELQAVLPGAVDLTGLNEDLILDPDLSEEAAAYSEKLMEEFFEKGAVTLESLRNAILDREVFPVTAGSALKMEGVDGLLELLKTLAVERKYPEEFSAKVYKITRDMKGARLTNLKVTGGTLRNKMLLTTGKSGEDEEAFTEKVEQIRIYNGEKFTTVSEAGPGTVCAVLGLSRTYGGQTLGDPESSGAETVPMIEPAVTYTLLLPRGTDLVPVLQKMRELEEEDPTLRVGWEEKTGEIRISVMGEIEKDLLRYRIKERFDLDCDFGPGRIIYKETISKPVVGIGHYEPLRHYAEVRLLMEPLPQGSGLVFETAVPEDELKGNWQRLILKHLKERRHKGTLLGSEITDMKITLIAGRAHLKHTEGGDFRQATYRAVRQGLRKALDSGDVKVLEPMYDFTILIPEKHIGRVMTDMERAGAEYALGESVRGAGPEGDLAVIKGRGPVSTLSEYQMELNSFTEGFGRFEPVPAGYGPCHDQDRVVSESSYDCDSDMYNPCGSVFTDHGAGVYVDWDMVDGIAHTEGGLRGLQSDMNSREELMMEAASESGKSNSGVPSNTPGSGTKAEEKALKDIFEKTYGKSKRDEQLLKEARARSTRLPESSRDHYPAPNPKSMKGRAPSYLVIDGYNVLYSWEELSELRKINIDGARESLIDLIENYQGYTGTGATVVFDGYRVKGNAGTVQKYGDLNVVYTGEAETADRFIEEFVFSNGKKYDLTVVTSDRQVQMSSFGDGAERMSSREFHDRVMETSEEIRDKLKSLKTERNRPFEKVFSEKGED